MRLILFTGFIVRQDRYKRISTYKIYYRNITIRLKEILDEITKKKKSIKLDILLYSYIILNIYIFITNTTQLLWTI